MVTYIQGNCIAVIALCVFNLIFFYLYYISECMCVSFSLFFFSFLISILYVYVRNALLKQKNKFKKKNSWALLLSEICERLALSVQTSRRCVGITP